MARSTDLLALDAFSTAATRVPAYRTLLREAGVRLEEIQSPVDFRRLPTLDKRNTFQRFRIEELCVDGKFGLPGTVLTSSGHSGVFAFGLTEFGAREATTQWVDDSLDLLFAVRARPSLLINCLPMGVKVPTHACTLAETSVRPDMVVGLLKALGRHYAQAILIGEAAFLKLVLETGRRSGVNFHEHPIHLILGEEPLAENARRYLGGILGHELRHPEKGVIFSSMGVAELGLNLFFEVPPVAPLILLRRALHLDASLRDAVLGPCTWVPPLFTYDPQRVFVEFDLSGRLIVTTLDPQLRIPLVRYATGDRGAFVGIPAGVRPALTSLGIACELLDSIPIVAIAGRGEYALAGQAAVHPEIVKEGIYHRPDLAERTTANFRLVSDPSAALIRIQLSPGIDRTAQLEREFHAAIGLFLEVPFTVRCERYEDFGDGMALDYERKFQYVARKRDESIATVTPVNASLAH